MEQRYHGVISRTLDRAERRVPINEEETPLVIEPLESSSAAFLRDFLTSNSSQVLGDISKHGALLLRGFDVTSAIDFEQYIHSIRGMCGMHEVLFSEPGRTLADGTTYVFYTNKMMKTGGTLNFGIFHTENYAVPDVPHYVSFWCQTPGKLGGETGLVNMAKVHADLPDALKRKLEERVCLVSLYPLTQMLNRYGVRAEHIKQFCEGAALPVVTVHGSLYVAIYKPSVIQHPLTKERTLLVNCFFFSSIERPLLKAFLADYSGWEWVLHRLFWKASWLRSIITRMSARRARDEDVIHVTKPPPPLADAAVLSTIISHEECQMLAKIMRRRYSSFVWKRGDILIVDNLKMAHNGMAGQGKRELKVMMCNPVPLPSLGASPGLYVVPRSNEPRECLGAQLTRFRGVTLNS